MAKEVAALGFVSRSGGLLHEVNTTAGLGEGIMTWAQVAPFDTGKMVDVSPDRAESAISFFQVGVTRVVRQDTYLTQRENEVTFTCWINGDKTKAGTGTEIEEKIVAALRKFRPNIEQGSPVRSVDIEYIGDSEGEAINKWGWEGKMLQYGQPPHLLFQHKFRVRYMVAVGCNSQTVDILNPAC